MSVKRPVELLTAPSPIQQYVYSLQEDLKEARESYAALEAKAARLAEALGVIADCPEYRCCVCNWAGHEDALVGGGIGSMVDCCPRCNSDDLEDFEADVYATKAIAAPSPASQEEAPEPPVCEVCGGEKEIEEHESFENSWGEHGLKRWPCPACAADKEK